MWRRASALRRTRDMQPELFITRHNELIDPIVRVWSWQIPVYLFLGGWVAGMMILTGITLLKGRYRNRNCVCSSLPGVGLVLLSLGMLALFLDLEHKRYVWRLYTTFQWTSPMSWGSWILLLVYPVIVVSGLVRPPAPIEDLSQAVERASNWLRARPHVVRAIGTASIGLGAALGIYTGILLSALGARPLWNSGALGLLFLVSGLSGAAAFGHVVARHPDEREALASLDNILMPVELVLLALFMFGLLAGSAPQVEAAKLFLGGSYTAAFWVFVVFLGIVIPLFYQSLAVRHIVRHNPIAPIMVLAGGLALRWVLVSAGQVSHWAHGAMRIH
jgi:formate-dependent nitrite reductase membrane component NrfD